MSSSLPADNQQPAPHFCCYQLDPIQDPRWAHLVQTHCKASVFHTVAWLRALRRTYGYEPVAFTTSPPTSELKNGIVFCRVHSWLTGRRLVSLPFSDHCEPLCDSAEDVNFLIRYVQTALEHGDWKYLQVRPINEDFSQAGDGIGCSFWMLGSNFPQVGWPACGETDIMENSGETPAQNGGTIHGPGYSGAGGITAARTIEGRGNVPRPRPRALPHDDKLITSSCLWCPYSWN